MSTFPHRTLILRDGAGKSFGFLRLAAPGEGQKRWAGLFDIRPNSPEQDARSEVRWLAKRGYKRCGEHRISQGNDGEIHVRQGDFNLTLEPLADGGYLSQRPAPPVSAVWDTSEG